MLDFEPSAATGPEYAMTWKSLLLEFEPSAATGPEYAMTRKSSMLDGLFWGSGSGATLQREPSFQ